MIIADSKRTIRITMHTGSGSTSDCSNDFYICGRHFCEIETERGIELAMAAENVGYCVKQAEEWMNADTANRRILVDELSTPIMGTTQQVLTEKQQRIVRMAWMEALEVFRTALETPELLNQGWWDGVYEAAHAARTAKLAHQVQYGQDNIFRIIEAAAAMADTAYVYTVGGADYTREEIQLKITEIEETLSKLLA